MKDVTISQGNSKMGMIRSVSLPSVVTCVNCKCNTICYARKIERLRPNVARSYIRNLQTLTADPDRYWRMVEGAIKASSLFRFHVSGDIPDSTYFDKMVEVAARNQHCKILCFTKKYGIVNTYLSKVGRLPDNLRIIFSAWIGLKMVNPFLLPEAHIRFKNGETTARPDAIECFGNCSECATCDGGCWSMKPGDQVVFNQH